MILSHRTTSRSPQAAHEAAQVFGLQAGRPMHGRSRPRSSFVPSGIIAAIGLFLASCTTNSRPSAVADAGDGAYADDPREPSAIESAVIAAGTDPAKLAAVEGELLAALRAPNAAPAYMHMQEAAQHLGYVLQAHAAPENSPALAALGAMLADESRVELARLALDRVPGAAVDQLYVRALSSTTGSTRLALIQGIGARGIASAVPSLAPLLTESDPATVAAIVSALGQIGGAPALAALERVKEPLAPAVLNARLAAARRADAPTLARTAEEILRNPAAPMAQRSAALRCLIDARPESAVAETQAVLRGSEIAFQEVALEAVATLPASGAAAELANALDAFAPAVQPALLAALATRGDAQAVPGLLKALEGSEGELRLAILETLGRLPGDVAMAQRLASLAAGSSAEARAAGASLARLRGPGIDEYVREQAKSGEPKLRAVFVQQIGERSLTEAIPFLLEMRQESELPLRLAALDALRSIAPPTAQGPVIDWAVGATERSEQTRAARALISIILRDGDVEARTAAVVAALDRRDSAARLVLLPVLPRIAGDQALAAAGRLARDADEAVATAAVTELGRWPDDAALPSLIDVAQESTRPRVRTAAVRGASDFLARSERSSQVRSLIELPLEAPEINGLLMLLSRCSDQAALKAAQRHLQDPATAEAAQDGVDAITSNLAGPPEFTASNAAADLGLLTDGRPDTAWVVPNTPGEWLQADLRHSRPVRKIVLDHGSRQWDFPAEVDVFISDDPAEPGERRAAAEGKRRQTVITLPAGVRGRYVWIRQTGTREDNAWAIAEFTVD